MSKENRTKYFAYFVYGALESAQEHGSAPLEAVVNVIITELNKTQVMDKHPKLRLLEVKKEC